MQTQNITYLSLGTNQGDKAKNLQNAINQIDKKVGNVLQISSIYKTASWGFNSDDFYNICIKAVTKLDAYKLLETLLIIEKDLGRQQKTKEEYEDRIIDIDILLFNNDVILSKDLIIPHAKMLVRRFVMIPLAEIAPSIIHPLTKEQITNSAKKCNDNSEIQSIDIKLLQPVSISDKYNYIAIEGNIGAGKTSLTKKLSEDFNAKIILERFAENAFLPKFYNDKERFAFPLEMSFLADRYQQLTDDLGQFDLFKSFIISDYYIFKSLIFAQVTLQKDEYLLLRKIFNIMYKEITKPDLYIYLYQNTERLLENIKTRGRSYEQRITSSYLKKIQEGYQGFIKTEENLKILLIDVSEKDFIKKNEDYHYIVDKIKCF
ncbi:2-amino-4-hydroxy-6-hydroxymethyldihydropteridine diphosphokinase [uncultured Polaribacter sp.]|uniref:2-amino-4-hydroxy-6- hydroxymethyldihydropteridine diphosphokinase n=1 Tax=uncultured Polaribacter sp. TaxID=174711 RepID=UPI0026104C21|nr:2-amino-4-hydroxy-6-hydroxymethyldihydropteridine diphosphokinase [uncultured Polaribacter sp.]